MNLKKLLLVVVLVVAAAQADASTCDITEYPASGTLTAERMNQRIRQTEACINGNIDNTNLSASSAISLSKLATQNAVASQSFTLFDEDADGNDGESVGPLSTTLRKWRIPFSGTVIGMTVALRCPDDVTGTPGDCTGSSQSVNVTLKAAGSAIKTFSGLATTTTQTDFALASSVSNATDLTLEVSGTVTDVNFIDVVVYEKINLQ